MTKIILDKKGICEYQKNRDPYLMIDYASEIIPGKSANGYKDLKNGFLKSIGKMIQICLVCYRSKL